MPRKYRRRANLEWLHPVVHLLGVLAVWVYDFLRWVGKKLGLGDGSADVEDRRRRNKR